eukprot:scaffold18871_cov143-Isochrysis_galbana.AAC.2
MARALARLGLTRHTEMRPARSQEAACSRPSSGRSVQCARAGRARHDDMRTYTSGARCGRRPD